MAIVQAWNNLGDPNVPRDVYRRRSQVRGALLRVGTPVLIKHRYNILDVENGTAQRSPNYARWAGQTRANDPVSHGVGFVSVETTDNEWISPDGHIVLADDLPGQGFSPAPLYRGYGPGYLTWVIQPDAPVDTFKVTPTGVFTKEQNANGVAPWFPTLHDNDLMINVTLGEAGQIISTDERYQLKQVTPVSVRGMDRRGGRERNNVDALGGNRFSLNQTFQMELLPITDEAYKVETDR